MRGRLACDVVTITLQLNLDAALRFGLPKDIVSAVDPVTVYALGATLEALASAGLAADPYELYKHCHVSEIGNSIGGGMGGMVSLQGIFKHRLLDAQGLQSDQLQESFINVSRGDREKDARQQQQCAAMQAPCNSVHEQNVAGRAAAPFPF
jgi:3-oxoacyl-(acyl-carrier-protein) synthase